MGAYDKFCQSCGMPMEKDPGRGGTMEDGTRTQQYCSLCYEKGAFKDDFTQARWSTGFLFLGIPQDFCFLGIPLDFKAQKRRTFM